MLGEARRTSFPCTSGALSLPLPARAEHRNAAGSIVDPRTQRHSINRTLTFLWSGIGRASEKGGKERKEKFVLCATARGETTPGHRHIDPVRTGADSFRCFACARPHRFWSAVANRAARRETVDSRRLRTDAKINPIETDGRARRRPRLENRASWPRRPPTEATGALTFRAGGNQRQEERHEGGHLENDERDVLERFPHEPPERLGRLRRDRVRAERLPPVINVLRRAR